MSTARHPRINILSVRLNQTIQTLLRCYCVQFGFDWTFHLSMVEFYYNCSNNEATSHLPYEAMYGF